MLPSATPGRMKFGEGAGMSIVQGAKRGQAAAPTQMRPARLRCAGLGAQQPVPISRGESVYTGPRGI